MRPYLGIVGSGGGSGSEYIIPLKGVCIPTQNVSQHHEIKDLLVSALCVLL